MQIKIKCVRNSYQQLCLFIWIYCLVQKLIAITDITLYIKYYHCIEAQDISKLFFQR